MAYGIRKGAVATATQVRTKWNRPNCAIFILPKLGIGRGYSGVQESSIKEIRIRIDWCKQSQNNQQISAE